MKSKFLISMMLILTIFIVYHYFNSDVINDRIFLTQNLNVIEAVKDKSKRSVPYSAKKYVNASKQKNDVPKERMFYDSYLPLSEEDKTQFQFIIDQVSKLRNAGYITHKDLPRIRDVLSRLGDRFVASMTKELDHVVTVLDQQKANQLVSDLDLLDYLAQAGHPVSLKAIQLLALRKVDWDASGVLLYPSKANITFEAFDLFSKFNPEVARNHLTTISREHLQAYIVRYIYGRKLIGLTEKEIKKELEQVFGDDLIKIKMKEV